MQSNKISITKDFQSGLGPLGGVLTAMKWVKEKNKKYKWISTFPVDTPFFSKKELKFSIRILILIKTNYSLLEIIIQGTIFLAFGH